MPERSSKERTRSPLSPKSSTPWPSRLQKYRDSSLGELLQAQQDLQAAIDSLPDPVLVIASGGELLHVNRAAEALLGVKLSEAIDWLGAVEPELRAVLERVRAHVLSGKGPYVPKGLEEATRVQAPEGERHLLPRASPVYDEERTVIGTTIVLQDVTRLLRFDELKNNLVATVAHEFRTPLTSIRMAIHLCTEGSVGPLTPKQADLLFAAREDCDRLQTIVDELLDVSRLQEGRPALQRSPVSAEALVREAVNAHDSEAEGANVHLRPEVLPGVGNVMADPERIQIVLSNLITNAIHHSPRAPRWPRAPSAPTAGCASRSATTDRGFSPEHQRAIFERFYQAPGGKPGRAGLGLSIAKDIVDEHGGSIGVESEPGKGARFWFRLPPRTKRSHERVEAQEYASDANLLHARASGISLLELAALAPERRGVDAQDAGGFLGGGGSRQHAFDVLALDLLDGVIAAELDGVARARPTPEFSREKRPAPPPERARGWRRAR